MARNKKIALSFAFILFWILVWEGVSLIVDLSFAIPRPIPTLLRFFSLLGEKVFYLTIFSSLARILCGLLLGIVIGIFLAFLSVRFRALHIGISQLMTVIKATPVASFILVLWVLIGRDTVPIAIASLMVAPIVYQNLYNGYFELDRPLAELLDIYRVPFWKRMKIFILPHLLRYLIPAVISAAGLAWKSGIAAEIIAYTKDSIGRQISDAKNYFEGETMFAWTLVVILLSLFLEFLLSFVMRRFSQNVSSD